MDGFDRLFGSLTKMQMGHGLELQGDLGFAFGESFVRSNVEWDTRPAPVIDHEFDRRVGFDGRGWIHTTLLSIAGYRTAIDNSGTILASNGIVRDLAVVDGANGFDQSHLFVAH